MHKSISLLAILATIILSACGGNNAKNEQEGHDLAQATPDSATHSEAADDVEIKQIAVTYTIIDSKAAETFKAIVDHYLQVKNALVNDDAKQAAKGADAMADVLGDFDKSLLTAEQKKAYDAIGAELKEHAEHIGKNADNIKHQRSHFEEMSLDIYDLVKAFGAGRPVYHDHCPMAHENQGAMWISEIKEVKNPYFGAEMLTCGTVEEVIK